MSSKDDEQALARIIIRYFLRHRFAADTVEGLVRWRIPEEQLDQNIQKTVRAIQILLDRGLVREIPSSEAPMFALDPRHVADAEQFVSQEKGHN